MRILIVEDEARLASNIIAAFRTAGFAVDHAADGAAGSLQACRGMYDAIVLDLMLPERNGRRVLTDVRSAKVETPVLILTAQDGKDSIIDLLNMGADDYLSKPFDLGELIARVKALIRRGKGLADPVIHLADVKINTVSQTVHRADRLIDLSPTEYRILEYLAHRPRAIVSKQEMLEHLYDFDWEHHSNVIEAHVSNLRKKLDAENPISFIETLRHRGYRLRVEAIAI